MLNKSVKIPSRWSYSCTEQYKSYKNTPSKVHDQIKFNNEPENSKNNSVDRVAGVNSGFIGKQSLIKLNLLCTIFKDFWYRFLKEKLLALLQNSFF